MPIIRKVILLGNSKAITLPKSWFKFYEKESGKQIKAVTIKVNKKLTVEPYILKTDESMTEKTAEQRISEVY